MSINPYQAPIHEGLITSSSTDVVRRIRGPSTGLMLLLAIQIVGYIVIGLLALADTDSRSSMFAAPIRILIVVVHFAVMSFMFWSMLQIRRLREIGFGRIAAGLACIPFVSPWVWMGIPFGIWLIVILLNPATVHVFTEQLQDSQVQTRVPES